LHNQGQKLAARGINEAIRPRYRRKVGLATIEARFWLALRASKIR
jgi:hypothetical protein